MTKVKGGLVCRFANGKSLATGTTDSIGIKIAKYVHDTGNPYAPVFFHDRWVNLLIELRLDPIGQSVTVRKPAIKEPPGLEEVLRVVKINNVKVIREDT